MNQQATASVGSSAFSAWLARLALAVLLWFGSEVLLWLDPPGRAPVEWLPLIAGYIALSAVVLDLGARYRVRDLFSLMALAGIYGLAAGLLLNPAMALIDVPRTLATRVLGAHTLTGLLMLGLFLALCSWQARRGHVSLLVGGAVVGFAWGVWAHWFPVVATKLNYTEPTLSTLLFWGGGGLVMIAVLFFLIPTRTTALVPGDLQLSLGEWVAVLVILAALLLRRLGQGVVDSISLTAIPVVAAFCWVLLWFQKREKGKMLLDSCIPMHAPSLPWLTLSIIAFLGSGALGYSLPRGPNVDTDQFGLLIALFSMYGLVWLPTASVVLGVRGYRRMTRAGQV